MEGDRKAADPRLPGCAISIHSLRMEGDAERTMEEVAVTSISIHSLRMEGDTVPIFEGLRHNISIHSLRMEGDALARVIYPPRLFQSTPSAWRETRL